jgi:hypothetical protein
MPSSQYTDIKRTCSAARYPEQHRPGCYSHPLALPDQKLIRDVPRRPMKFPHATAAFRGSLPCWSSLARCARARAAAPPAVARAVAARHAAPHLAYAVVRHAAIHSPTHTGASSRCLNRSRATPKPPCVASPHPGAAHAAHPRAGAAVPLPRAGASASPAAHRCLTPKPRSEPSPTVRDRDTRENTRVVWIRNQRERGGKEIRRKKKTKGM